jgi:hypothetical protein
MKKLVRRMLVHFDRFGAIAALTWVLSIGGGMFIASLLIQYFFSNFTDLSKNIIDFVVIVIIIPFIVYFSPVFWASGFLFVERYWIFLGIYRLLGRASDTIRDKIEKLARKHQN